MKAQCPRLNKPVNAASLDAPVSFGCVEVVSKASKEWAHPKRAMRSPGTSARPLPSQVTVGDYLKPSVFVRAARLEQEELSSRGARPEETGENDSDSEEWVRDFEAKYTDVTRIKPKAKDRQPAVMRKRGTPAKIEACHLAPLEVVYPEGAELLATGAEEPPKGPRFTKLKVALDSGAGAHVMNRKDAPGYKVNPSAMSRAGAAFLAADGGRIANYGEMNVNMLSFDSKGAAHRISSRFEAADVTRALWSVGLICDSGLNVRFSSEKAVVEDQRGTEVCVFNRENGLYITEVQVECPEVFQRPGH